MAPVLSFRGLSETAQLAKEYLEVAFHLILCLRAVYPADLFRHAKKYGSPVWQSRAPELTAFIGRIMECVEEELLKGTVQRVVLVIKEDDITQTPLERYVFDFEWLIPSEQIPKDNSDFTPAAAGLARGDVEDLFRACLRKLFVSTAYLKKLPNDTEFATVLEMRKGAPPPQSKAAQRGDYPCEWIPAETRQTSERRENEESMISPVAGVRLGMLSMDVRVEETGEKFKLSTDDFSSSGEPMPQVDRKGKGRAL
ncbi:uncharacterized protein JCM6883_006105 [Sporobolomyces salmoneus]|uniref:uncharacterized protein n=1 Tax=Sporobolomyces salmoneus TaxID=183962 RepID=UPI0031724801